MAFGGLTAAGRQCSHRSALVFLAIGQYSCPLSTQLNWIDEVSHASIVGPAAYAYHASYSHTSLACLNAQVRGLTGSTGSSRMVERCGWS